MQKICTDSCKNGKVSSETKILKAAQAGVPLIEKVRTRVPCVCAWP